MRKDEERHTKGWSGWGEGEDEKNKNKIKLKWSQWLLRSHRSSLEENILLSITMTTPNGTLGHNFYDFAEINFISSKRESVIGAERMQLINLPGSESRQSRNGARVHIKKNCEQWMFNIHEHRVQYHHLNLFGRRWSSTAAKISTKLNCSLLFSQEPSEPEWDSERRKLARITVIKLIMIIWHHLRYSLIFFSLARAPLSSRLPLATCIHTLVLRCFVPRPCLVFPRNWTRGAERINSPGQHSGEFAIYCRICGLVVVVAGLPSFINFARNFFLRSRSSACASVLFCDWSSSSSRSFPRTYAAKGKTIVINNRSIVSWIKKFSSLAALSSRFKSSFALRGLLLIADRLIISPLARPLTPDSRY